MTPVPGKIVVRIIFDNRTQKSVGMI
jgi:hypothetical protein